MRKVKVEKPKRYDLWADLSLLKAAITFGQLLMISLMARKTLKEGMPVTRRKRRAKTRVVVRVQLQGRSCAMKTMEIETIVVDKVIPNVLVNGRSGLNILSKHTMKKLGLNLTGPSPFIINMANESPSVHLGMRYNIVGRTFALEDHFYKDYPIKVVCKHYRFLTTPYLTDKRKYDESESTVDTLQ